VDCLSAVSKTHQKISKIPLALLEQLTFALYICPRKSAPGAFLLKKNHLHLLIGWGFSEGSTLISKVNLKINLFLAPALFKFGISVYSCSGIADIGSPGTKKPGFSVYYSLK
jgi:hypothetical protein